MGVDYFAQGNEPTTIMLSYYDQLGGDEQEIKVSMMYNAAFLFAAAFNLRHIIFAFNEQEIHLQRQELEQWLELSLYDQHSEKAFLKRVNKKLKAGYSLPI